MIITIIIIIIIIITITLIDIIIIIIKFHTLAVSQKKIQKLGNISHATLCESNICVCKRLSL